MELKLYTIRLCTQDDYDKLIDFLRSYWGENHIFCRNKEVFEFQHGDAKDGEYNFIIAEHNDSHEIHAVLGFISSSTYDGGSRINPIFVAGALWKVRDDIHNQEIGKLGLGVLYYLLKKYPDSAYVTLGLSGFSQQIYEALHFDFGLMEHYYIASSEIKEFIIASFPKIDFEARINEEYNFEEISEIPEGFKTHYYPQKNNEYIKNRYVNHPFYKYELIGVFHRRELCSVWIIRMIEVMGHKCIRLVDILGNIDGITNVSGNVISLLKDREAEFIDCYCHGISSLVFERIGFKIVDGETIIPNYYEPFEKKNVDIYYAAYSKSPVVLFKGDGDQDRPSIL